MATSASTLSLDTLPIVRTRLIGREAEVASGRAFLLDEAVPLLTLTGPGGVGKTRLVLAIAGAMTSHYDDGAVFVDLASLGDPNLVVPAVARSFGIAEGGDQPLVERLVAALQRRHLLLVLDNCEHLLTAVAELVSPLLVACPQLQVLATSRAPLRIRGEQELPIEPLPLPPLDSVHPRDLADNPAVRLFVDRARAAKPRFPTANATLHDVAAICRELDGLPLAIELAAAQVRVLAPSALRERLRRRLPLLEGGARDAPARQRTMRDAIAWSYGLLSPEEQDLFRRLAVFAGGFTLDAAQAVATREPTTDVLPRLARLVEYNLVRREDRVAPSRYHLLETIREFAQEHLGACGDANPAQDAHAAYFLALGETGMRGLNGPGQVAWLARLESEHPNLRAALERFAHSGNTNALRRLAAALWLFWFIRGYPREGRAWLTQALAVSHGWSPALREALHGASMLAGNQGDHVQAAARAEQLLALAREQDDDEAVARALFLLSFAATYRSDRDQALTLANEALAITRKLGTPHQLTDVLNRLGIEEHNQGNYARAAVLYEEAQAIWRDRGCTWELVCVTTNLGVTAQAQGNIARAAGHYRESLLLLQDIGETWMMEELLALVAALAAETGDRERAARLIGATDRLLEVTGLPLVPFVQVLYERARARLRGELGEEEFAAMREVGARLTRTQALLEAYAVALALSQTTATDDTDRGILARSGLTPRELDVLRLVVAGHSNAQIAAMLFISVPTVKRHLSNMLAKLELPSRSALTAYAHTHGLV